MKQWNHIEKDVLLDMLYTIFSKIGTKQLFYLALYGLLIRLQGLLRDIFHFSIINESLPKIFQLIISLLIVEFFSYWFHRKSHEKRTLWKLHQIHHSPRKMWILNVSRAHPLDVILRFIIPFAIIIVLGADSFVLATIFILGGVVAFLQHSNLRLDTGFLNYIFATPTVHHWHHSSDRDKANHNYGQILVVYDLIFNTFYLENREECEEVGSKNSELPNNFFEQIIFPFKRKEKKK